MSYTKDYYIGSERISAKTGTCLNIVYYPQGYLATKMPNLDANLVRTSSDDKVDKAENNINYVHEKLSLNPPALNSTNDYVEESSNFNHLRNQLDYFYFHPDHLGSSSYITNAAGTVSQHMEYLPFGELLVDEHTNSYNSPFKYNGKEFDEETGNYYYGARYYDPRTSIWLSVDPEFAKFPSWSPYNYTLNNPINLIDPDGRSPKPPAYYMNSQGFWIDGDEGFGEYMGNVAPSGGQGGYMELTKIRGRYYHKNTSNLFAKIGNALGGDFVEHKPYDRAEESFNSELQGMALGYGVLKAGGLAFNLLKSAGGSLWKLAPLERGFVYESMMNLKGAMKSSNFPKIDAFYKGVATSVKTLDLGAKSYLKNNAVFNKLTGYVDDLAGFNGATWGDDVVRGSDITKRVLEVGIPRGASSSQVQQINNAVKYGAEKGVKVNVRVVE